jgi:hypothetical protein
MVETDVQNVDKNLSHLQHNVVHAGSSWAQRILLRRFSVGSGCESAEAAADDSLWRAYRKNTSQMITSMGIMKGRV